jgi:hypothetical protein
MPALRTRTVQLTGVSLERRKDIIEKSDIVQRGPKVKDETRSRNMCTT